MPGNLVDLSRVRRTQSKASECPGGHHSPTSIADESSRNLPLRCPVFQSDQISLISNREHDLRHPSLQPSRLRLLIRSQERADRRMGHLRRKFPRRQDERLIDDNHLLHEAMIPQFRLRGLVGNYSKCSVLSPSGAAYR